MVHFVKSILKQLLIFFQLFYDFITLFNCIITLTDPLVGLFLQLSHFRLVLVFLIFIPLFLTIIYKSFRCIFRQ